MGTVKAIVHNKQFKIIKVKDGPRHSMFVISLLKRNHQPAKRQPLDSIYKHRSDALYAIRCWDLKG